MRLFTLSAFKRELQNVIFTSYIFTSLLQHLHHTFYHLPKHCYASMHDDDEDNSSTITSLIHNLYPNNKHQ